MSFSIKCMVAVYFSPHSAYLTASDRMKNEFYKELDMQLSAVKSQVETKFLYEEVVNFEDIKSVIYSSLKDVAKRLYYVNPFKASVHMRFILYSGDTNRLRRELISNGLLSPDWIITVFDFDFRNMEVVYYTRFV